jgi:acetyl esterase
MAIALMQMVLERNLPARVGLLVLLNPVTDTHMKMQSYETYKDNPFLPADTLDWMINAFLPNEDDRKTALASPLTFASDDVLRKFPPTTVFVGDVDPLADEGKAFGRRLQGLGVEAAIVQADGQMHAFVLLKAIRNSPTARAIVEFAALKMRKAFPPLAAP